MEDKKEKEKEVWNSETQTQPNFEKEAEKLSTEVDYFKVPKGETKIKFLSNGKLYKAKKDWNDTEKEYFRVKIEVDGEEYVWDMNKGTTPGSKFGQLMRFGRVKNGLKGETVRWYRQGEGTDTKHILMGLDDLEEEYFVNEQQG